MNPEEVNHYKQNFFWQTRVSQTFEGDENGSIEYDGKRFNIMGADYFMSGIIESLYDLYADASGGIIHDTGKEYGKELLEVIDAEEEDERFGQLLGLLQFMGYSKIEASEGGFEVNSSPTAEEHLKTDHDEKKTCYFLAGILTGAVQRVYDVNFEYTEMKCKADGDDICFFERKEDVY